MSPDVIIWCSTELVEVSTFTVGSREGEGGSKQGKPPKSLVPTQASIPNPGMNASGWIFGSDSGSDSYNEFNSWAVQSSVQSSKFKVQCDKFKVQFNSPYGVAIAGSCYAPPPPPPPVLAMSSSGCCYVQFDMMFTLCEECYYYVVCTTSVLELN